MGGCAHEHIAEARLLGNLHIAKTHIQGGLTEISSKATMEGGIRPAIGLTTAILGNQRGLSYEQAKSKRSKMFKKFTVTEREIRPR